MNCAVCFSEKQKHFLQNNGFDLFRCDSCGLVYVFPMPDEKVLKDFYDGYHKTKQYRSKLASKVRRAKSRIARIRKYVRGGSFLDIGCNVGFAVEAARQFGYEAQGIDIDGASVDAANGIFKLCHFDKMSAQEMAGSGRKFDLIYCSEVIEHLTELDDFIQAILCLMNNNSIVYLTTPDLGHYKLKKPFLKDLNSWDGIRPPEHLFYFSKKNLNILFERHGLLPVSFQFSTKPTMKVVLKKKNVN